MLHKKLLEETKVYIEVAEYKEEFQIKPKLKGIMLEEKNVKIGKQGRQEEDRLHENILKREDKDVQMVGGVNQGKEAPHEEGPEMKTTIEDMDSIKEGDMDT